VAKNWETEFKSQHELDIGKIEERLPGLSTYKKLTPEKA
jgi:hypothetical protein